MIQDLLIGLQNELTFECISLIFLGVALGIVFGSIPGLSANMAVTLCLPLTYTMGVIPGITLLIALYLGGISGGLISAILINIPGTPASIATCFDGAPMAKKGRPGGRWASASSPPSSAGCSVSSCSSSSPPSWPRWH